MSNHLDRRDFLRILGFTGIGCMLSSKLGWLENIVSGDRQLAEHIWKTLTDGMIPSSIADGGSHGFFMTDGPPSEVDGRFSIVIASVPIRRDMSIIDTVREVEAQPEFSHWICNSMKKHVHSFFRGPDHVFDEGCRELGMSVEFTGSSAHSLEGVVNTQKFRAGLQGRTLRDRLAYAPKVVEMAAKIYASGVIT